MYNTSTDYGLIHRQYIICGHIKPIRTDIACLIIILNFIYYCKINYMVSLKYVYFNIMFPNGHCGNLVVSN